MSRSPRIAAVLICLAGLAPWTAPHADAPLRTDNAEVPEQGNCKVEAGFEWLGDARAAYVSPACVPFGTVELGMGYARVRNEEGAWSNAYSLQAKLPLVRKEDDRPFALAVGGALLGESSSPGPAFGSTWINVPASFYFDAHDLRVDLNAGMLWRRDQSAVVTWGVAAEYDAGVVTLVGDIYRLEPGRPKFLAGLRYELTEDCSLNVGMGRGFASDDNRWLVTAGIKLESPAFLK